MTTFRAVDTERRAAIDAVFTEHGISWDAVRWTPYYREPDGVLMPMELKVWWESEALGTEQGAVVRLTHRFFRRSGCNATILDFDLNMDARALRELARFWPPILETLARIMELPEGEKWAK